MYALERSFSAHFNLSSILRSGKEKAIWNDRFVYGLHSLAIAMIELAKYLGRDVGCLLSAKPFCDWQITRSVYDDSDPPLVGYVFDSRGVQLNCDRESEKVRSLFFEKGGYAESLSSDISFSLRKQDVRSLFGPPSKSGDKLTHAVLGDFGPWDRFQFANFVLHIEYGFTDDCIERITLMRNDVAR